jgi:prophage regulatory protein
MTSFLRFPQVRTRVGLSRSTIYLKIVNGEFPKPISLGARAVAWLESDIDAWIAAQVKQQLSMRNDSARLTPYQGCRAQRLSRSVVVSREQQ